MGQLQFATMVKMMKYGMIIILIILSGMGLSTAICPKIQNKLIEKIKSYFTNDPEAIIFYAPCMHAPAKNLSQWRQLYQSYILRLYSAVNIQYRHESSGFSYKL